MASDDAEVVVLGVDPGDPRAAAELSRWIPANATAIYRTPGLGNPSSTDLRGRKYPPGGLVAWARRFRLRSVGDAAITATIESVAADRDVPERELPSPARPGSGERSRWWTVGAWTVTLFPVVVAIASGALLALDDGLLRWAFAALITIASLALLVGFHYAHAAAAIHRADPEIAGVAAREIASDEGRDNTDDDPASDDRPVLIVPERNAAGVAMALHDLGVPAEAHAIALDDSPADA